MPNKLQACLSPNCRRGRTPNLGRPLRDGFVHLALQWFLNTFLQQKGGNETETYLAWPSGEDCSKTTDSWLNTFLHFKDGGWHAAGFPAPLVPECGWRASEECGLRNMA